MPKTNPNETVGEQMDIEVTRAEANSKLAKAQAGDAYRQLRDAFILVNDSIKALREAQAVIHAYADTLGRSVQVTETLGKIERTIQANRKWMADNQPF